MAPVETTAPIDVTDLNWWAKMIFGIFDQGEWLSILVVIAMTYGAIYILKQIYYSLVNPDIQRPVHIRLMTIVAGYTGAFAAAKAGHLPTVDWWFAGSLAWIFAIAVYHILDFMLRTLIVFCRSEVVSKIPFIKEFAPFLQWLAKYLEKAYPYLKGRDRRKNKVR